MAHSNRPLPKPLPQFAFPWDGWLGKSLAVAFALGIFVESAAVVRAEIPAVLFYQGRVLMDDVAFEGVGHFKFALVDGTGSSIRWRSAVDGNSDGEPDVAVEVSVVRGLYGVHLGDTNLAHMAPIPVALFVDALNKPAAGNLFLRVWFGDGSGSFERLVPDQRLGAVGFAVASAHAVEADRVVDGAITLEKLAPGVLAAGNLTGSLSPAQIPRLDASQIGTGVLSPERLPAEVALKEPDVSSLRGAVESGLLALQAQLASVSSRLAALESLVPTGRSFVSASMLADDPTLAAAGYQRFVSFPSPGWKTGGAVAPAAPRWGHVAGWVPTLGRMLVWGGKLASDGFAGSGALYDPDSDGWQALPALEAPSPRIDPSLVLDEGTAAYVWGGYGESGYLGTGARYDYSSATWHALQRVDAPSGREGQVAVWTGRAMLIWGGRNAAGVLGDGALYEPDADRWRSIDLPGAPEPRAQAAGAWTGDAVIIWGGSGARGPLNSGSRLSLQALHPFDPASWSPMSLSHAPSPRRGAASVWTGTRFVVWGGMTEEALLGDGALYDPTNDTWSPLPNLGAPTPRAFARALWTGSELLILGGRDSLGPNRGGAAFNPTTGTWRDLPTLPDFAARTDFSAVWTGTECLVFGGQSGGAPVANLQRLDPQPSWYLYRKL